MKESPAEIAKFAAEMAHLSKQPNMRPFLTATERRRVEREEKREKEKAEEWEKEAKRRDEITAKWFDLQMKQLAPELWARFQATKDPEILANAGWQLDAEMTTDDKEGFQPVPVTLCAITRVERIFWEEPKKIKSKLVKP